MKIIMTMFILLMCLMAGCQSEMQSPPASNVNPISPTATLIKVVNSTNWLATVAILGVGAGFFAMLNGSTNGIKFIAACLVVLGLVLGVAQYGFWISLVSMLVSVGLLIYTVWVNKKALKEIITNVQLFKEDGSADDTILDEFKYWLSQQSKTTKTIVAETKEKL